MEVRKGRRRYNQKKEVKEGKKRRGTETVSGRLLVKDVSQHGIELERRNCEGAHKIHSFIVTERS